ncbi:craniofacial development protein 2-like [Planococcus citri]|uniref:craniofacial development protein 2-like n=1 Tax=Planococcus citri TaxID=170843 RepID=UPI0031F748D2
MELEGAFEEGDIQVLGLSEVRRATETLQITKNNHLLAHSSCENGQRGVGFLVHRNLINDVNEFRPISDRIALLSINFWGKEIRIIQVYAPTSAATESDSELFYEKLSELLMQQGEFLKDIFVMGDFNSQVGKGKNKDECVIGRYGYGKRNKRGWRLLRFCEEFNLKIMNTFYKKREGRLWTWMSPNQEFKAQIDYILTTNDINYITNCEAKNFSCYSDHRVVTCTLKLQKTKKFKRCNPKRNYKVTNENASAYQTEINTQILNNPTKNITEIIQNVSKNMIQEPKNQSNKGLPTTIKEMIKNREKMKCIRKKTLQDKIQGAARERNVF